MLEFRSGLGGNGKKKQSERLLKRENVLTEEWSYKAEILGTVSGKGEPLEFPAVGTALENLESQDRS